MKTTLSLLSALCLLLVLIMGYKGGANASPGDNAGSDVRPPGANLKTTSVSTVVTAADAFKALLTTSQINTLQKTFTKALARNWSNLPCGSSCRNGIQFSTLSATQLTAAKLVISEAAGTAVNEGYDEFLQILTADSLLGVVSSSGSYSKGIYFISFLNAPSTTGAWMLQFGGHHYAANIAFNGGKVIGVTPTFEGVEPKSFSVSSGTITYAPLDSERVRFIRLFSSLSTTQLSTAHLSTTFSDVVLGPGKDTVFPTTKAGLAVSTLSTAQQALVLDAMMPWVNDADSATAAVLTAIYQNELNATYIAYSGSTALTANADYVRIDGPSVWIEFVCQSGVVFTGVHYHSVWRDHKRDYGNYLSNTALPLDLISFSVTANGQGKAVSWQTGSENGIDHFEIERSDDQAKNFVTAGIIPAKNTASGSYVFTDNDVNTASVYYYRLKIVEYDGNSRYSNIVVIRNSLPSAISVYPNPAMNTISLSAPQSMNDATIRIINAVSGRTVLSITSNTGQKRDIDISGLASGIYLIRIKDGGLAYQGKFT